MDDSDPYPNMHGLSHTDSRSKHLCNIDQLGQVRQMAKAAVGHGKLGWIDALTCPKPAECLSSNCYTLLSFSLVDQRHGRPA